MNLSVASEYRDKDVLSFLVTEVAHSIVKVNII